jgi:glycerol uptake facilitator-like aquaporin
LADVFDRFGCEASPTVIRAEMVAFPFICGGQIASGINTHPANRIGMAMIRMLLRGALVAILGAATAAANPGVTAGPATAGAFFGHHIEHENNYCQ